MTKKTKKGYLWIFDQQDKWDEAASDKMTQLEQAQTAHLDWFNQHSTVSELLALRRPDLKRKHDAISTTTTASQIVPSEDVEKESSKSMTDTQTEDVVKLVGIQLPYADRTVMNKQTQDDPAHQTTTQQANAAENQAENVHKTNTIIIPPSKVKSTAIIKPYTSPTKTQPEKPKSRSFADDYNEEDDQVQIVVSARKSNAVPKEKQPRPTVFPARPAPQMSKSTPTKTISLTAHAKTPSSTAATTTTNTSTYRSAFMNRLFKTSRPSLKQAALPSASLSTSSNTAEAAAATTTTGDTSPNNNYNNKSDTYSYHPTIITKRSSTASVRSIGSSIHSTPIQASDIMPEPRFKRFKALQKVNQDPPAAAAAEQATHDLSTVEELDESSKGQSQLQQEESQQEMQSQSENQSQSSQENAAAFVIPAWGEGDRLRNQLEAQASTNFYEFFGRLQPIDLKDIFPY